MTLHFNYHFPLWLKPIALNGCQINIGLFVVFDLSRLEMHLFKTCYHCDLNTVRMQQCKYRDDHGALHASFKVKCHIKEPPINLRR